MRRLILIGGGHAHLEVLRQAAARRFAGGELVLVSPYPHHHYSGMVPGYLQRTYAEADLAFDLPALCRAAGARFVEASADRVDPDGSWVAVDGVRLACDLVSADVGGAPAGYDHVPGAREHSWTVRPITRAIALRHRLDDHDDGSGPTAPGAATGPGATARSPLAACIVGGGAAGVEVALAVRRRLSESRRPAEVTLVDRAPALLGEFSPGVRDRVARLLAERGVRVESGHAVAHVSADAIRLDSGESIPSTFTVWLTGAAPTALTAATDLPVDDRGFWLVDGALRTVRGGAVWGAGDCVTLRDHRWVPKAGVYAVRQGPVLAANLRVAVERGPGAPAHAFRRYVPQRHYLALLNTADGRALLRWHGLTAHTRWAWWLKDRIDRRFMAKYRIGHVRASASLAAAEVRARSPSTADARREPGHDVASEPPQPRAAPLRERRADGGRRRRP